MSPTREELAELVRWAMRIAVVFAKVSGLGHREDDLIERALQGLHEALGRFEPTRGVPIKGYARRRIVGELLDVLEDEARRSAWEVALEDASGDLPVGIEHDPVALARVGGVESFVLCVADDLHEDGESRYLRREARVELHRAVAGLSPEGRRIVELRYWEGLSWKDVAQALGLPVRTVQDHDQKLRESLKAALLDRDRVTPRGGGAQKKHSRVHREEVD